MSAFRNRKEGRYTQFDPSILATDNYERIYVTHTPVLDSPACTQFDIRTPHNSHMSTVAYLERTLRFELQYILDGEVTALGSTYQDPQSKKSPLQLATTGLNGSVMLMHNSPGYSMQNCMKHFQMQFEGSNVIDKPSEWLPVYSHLYPESLHQTVRGSSGSFLTDRYLPHLQPTALDTGTHCRIFTKRLTTHARQVDVMQQVDLEDIEDDRGVEVRLNDFPVRNLHGQEAHLLKTIRKNYEDAASILEDNNMYTIINNYFENAKDNRVPPRDGATGWMAEYELANKAW